MRKMKIEHSTFVLTDEILGFFEKAVTKFGNGAKIDCPKEYLGKKVYVLIRRDD